MKSVHLKIYGRVQGVFFRANTQKEAARLGITGWVRNTEDGAVEAYAEGDEATLLSFVAWCRRGPPSASVESVEAAWKTAEKSCKNFSIKY